MTWAIGLVLWGLVIAAAELARRRTRLPEQAEQAELYQADPAGPVVWTDAQLDRLLDEIKRHPRGPDV